MFIPMVLLELIDRYNEKGILFKSDKKVIWFNGKRVEHWCDIPFGDGKILFFKNKLYFKQGNLNQTNGIWFYDHGLWKYRGVWSDKLKKLLYHPLTNLNDFCYYADFKFKANGLYHVAIDGRIYINKKRISITKFHITGAGDHLLFRYYNGFIYSFYHFEKFELKTKKMTKICRSLRFLSQLYQIEIMNNLFYFCLPICKFIICYNPLTDTWQEDLMRINY